MDNITYYTLVGISLAFAAVGAIIVVVFLPWYVFKLYKAGFKKNNSKVNQ